MINRFDRLRHKAIIRRDDENHNVGDISTACSHRGEGSMSRRVDEGERRAIVTDAIGADMLSNSASLACGNTRLPNGVHQRRLAVVNVSHERDNGSARLKFFFLFNDRWRRCNDYLLDFVNTASFFAALLFQNEPVALRDF